jgi:hypothetical protein
VIASDRNIARKNQAVTLENFRKILVLGEKYEYSP